ncbi:hypothetical protein [Novosphingobium album (ex Hu et al. 2023)]|uniref:Uncharacterized protein n=1 Tax=Novosphingobium album (ex Hu et al. 2023) TaxID=2930093 RepID=A0ABT0B081_9SPHN|nr:hypothetical protein [Novosphingobium album (ex Hu et al. 2023)]MCJ2178415.1 hypothetical protein [Novosphingobium album (ex Hu et al. 2023)]
MAYQPRKSGGFSLAYLEHRVMDDRDTVRRQSHHRRISQKTYPRYRGTNASNGKSLGVATRPLALQANFVGVL